MTKMGPILVTKEVRELLKHNITNSLSIILLSVKAIKKRNDKELHRVELQVNRIEELIKRLSS